MGFEVKAGFLVRGVYRWYRWETDIADRKVAVRAMGELLKASRWDSRHASHEAL